MKKSKIFLSLIVLSFLFTSCEKKNAPNKISSDEESIDKNIDIKYLPIKKTFKNTDKKKSFEQKYGKGVKSSSISLFDAKGNLVSARVGDIDIGISLLPSIANSDAYSIFINYENKNKELGLEEENIEIGPIYKEKNSYSLFSFYKMKSPSGDILIVGQVQISDDFQYSKYSIINKYMNRMDYAYFYNSNQNIYPTSIRSDSILGQAEYIKEGDIKTAINMRVNEEDKYLKDLFKTYGIEKKNKNINIENSEIKVANFPKESDKIIKLLSIEKLENGKFSIK